MAAQPGAGGGVFWEEQQLIGRRIGQYEVVSFLGRGGTAMVFKVLDLETGQHRALKMTATDPSEAELHRFKREFRVMSRLAHPNVIAVYRYGVHECRPYFVMELIEGRDLRAYLRASVEVPGYYERLAEILAQVTRALAYIHDRHIVHRDLKPGNILVTHLGLVKVMDFGIAFEIEVTAPVVRQQTLMGTLAYVSPEQATGRKVDARSDLYSLGIILYELLTGQKPFTGNTLSQVVYKHLHEQAKSPLELNPHVPPPLAELALALMAKRPHDRPQSAQEVQVMLESFLAGDKAPLLDDSALELVSDTPPLHEPEFVGRERVMEALRARLSRLLTGKSGLAFVTGSAGLGKSRIIEELCRDDQLESAFIFSGRCLAQATSPYHGFREILRAALRRLLELDGSLGAALSTHQIGLLVQAFPELKAMIGPDIKLEPTPDSGAPEWLNLFTAVRAVLESLTDIAPVVLTFDDLDRADEASLALLQAVVRALVAGAKPRRLFILGTARPEALPHAAGFSGEISSPSGPGPGLWSGSARLQSMLEMIGFSEPPLVLALEPLTLEQVSRMVGSMLGHADDLEGLAEYLYSQSEGNPFFVEAILRALVAQGVVARHEHSITGCEWTMHLERMEAQAASIALPAGLQGALRKRLSLLDPRDLMVLQVAAIYGEPFGYGLIRDVTGFDEETLLDFLDRMLKAHLLTERAGERQAVYDFTHGKARELIVGDLPRQEQVLLHQRIGQVLAARHDPALTAATAHHLYEGRLYDEALPALIEAGERFARQQLYRLAVRPLAQAEEILARYRVPLEGRDDSRLKLRMDHALGVALHAIGRTEEAFEHLSLALTAVRQQEEPAIEAEIRSSLGHVHRERGEYRQARELYEEAITLLRKAGEGHRMGDTILGLGEILSRQGLITRAGEVYFEAQELALELQHRPGLAGAVLGQGEVALLLGRTPEAMRRLNEALQLFRDLEDRPGMVQALEAIGEAQRIQGQFVTAIESLSEAALMAREYDPRSKLAGISTVLGEVYLDLNVPTWAEGALAEGMAVCAKGGYIFHRAALYRVWGALKEQQGELSTALEAYRQGLKLAQGISAQVLTARLLAQVARLQLKLGEAGGAKRLIDKAVIDLTAAGAVYACGEAYLVAAQVRAKEEDFAGAHAAVNQAVALAEKIEARDLCFRALVQRFELPSPEGVPRNAGLLRAAGILHRLLEGSGSSWRARLLERPDLTFFLSTWPSFAPKDPSSAPL